MTSYMKSMSSSLKVDCKRKMIIQTNPLDLEMEYDISDVVLGEGSYGEVIKGTHRRTGIARAIKRIPKHGTSANDFEHEVKALVALDHPHIVKVIEYFANDESEYFYLVQEFCSGPDLFEYISNYMVDRMEVVPEKDVSVILRQCLKSVRCCHANGFIHRDIKPENFMFADDNSNIKMIDFGISVRHMLSSSAQNEVVGTPEYMAPEMLLGNVYDERADVFSLGIVLYVLLAGEHFMPEDDEEKKRLFAEDPGWIARRLSESEPLASRQVSDSARDLMFMMLQVDPKDRLTASQALMHPFIVKYVPNYLGDEKLHQFDIDVVNKMRHFGMAPPIKKIARLVMSHFASIYGPNITELRNARHMFRLLDRDGAGVVTLLKLRRAFVSRGLELSEDIEEVFSLCNCDFQGELTFLDFLACYLPDRYFDDRALAAEAFNLIGKLSHGRIDADDLGIMCRFSPRHDYEEMISVVGHHVDESGSVYVDFDDFLKLHRPGPDVRDNDIDIE